MKNCYLLALVFWAFSCSHFQRNPSSIIEKDIVQKYQNAEGLTDLDDINTLADLCADKIIEAGEESINKEKVSINNSSSLLLTNAYEFCLSNYIKIPSVNPPGNEHLTAKYLGQIFKRLDIPFKIFKVKIDERAERTNLVATLHPTGLSNGHEYINWFDWSVTEKNEPGPSLILLNHMDVVPAPKDKWSADILPFSGKILTSNELSKIHPNLADGETYLFGRGALDMKSIGMMQLFSMAMMKLSHVPTFKDIHFLAVADEEAGGIGARGAMLEMKKGGKLEALMGAEIVLNEGGMGIQKAIDGKGIYVIGTEEKGGAWMSVDGNNVQDIIESLAKMNALDFSLIQKITQLFKLDDLDLSLEQSKCHVGLVDVPLEKVNVLTSSVSAKIECEQAIKLSNNSFKKFQDKILPFKFNFNLTEKTLAFTIDSSSSAHGSISVGNTVLEVFALVLEKMKLIKLKSEYEKPDFYKYVTTIGTEGMLNELKKINKMIGVLRLFRTSTIDIFLMKQIENGLNKDGFFRTNCQWTTFKFSENEGRAGLDCRLLHPLLPQFYSENHAQAFNDLLNLKYRSGGAKFRLVEGWNVSTSPHNLGFQFLQDVLLSYDKNLVVAPYVFPAGSDSTYFREPHFWGNSELSSIPSYGFFPVETSADVLTTFHGSFERFPVSQIIPGLEKMYKAIFKLSSTFYTPVYK